MPRCIVVSLVVVCLLTLGAVSQAQVATVDDTSRTPIPGVGHDYIHALAETVDPSNGSVSLRIQFPTPKGRGLTIPFSFGYDSGSVHHLQASFYPSFGTAYWSVKPDAISQGGWSNSFPTVRYDSWEQDVNVLTGYNGSGPIYTSYPCYYATNYVFRDLSGGLHNLNLGSLTWSSGNPPPGGCPLGGPGPGGGGGDAQFLGMLPSSQGMVTQSPVTVYDTTGTVYTANYIEDRNGNRVNLTGGTITNNQGMYISNYTALTDALGRTLISGNGIGTAGTTKLVTIAGQTYQITWTSASANASIPSTWVGNSAGPSSQYDSCSPIPAMNDTQPVVSRITLPNGQQFRFYYGADNPNSGFNNPYGMLSEIDYPSGAWVRYTWKLSDTTNELADYPGFYWSACGTGSCPAAAQDGCLYQYRSPVVATRTVGFGGSASPAQTQTFTYSTTWATPTSGNVGGTAWTQKSTQVTTQDNITGKSALTAYTYSPIALPPPYFSNTTIVQQAAVEKTIQYYDWNGSPLQTVNKTWQDLYHLKSEQTVIAATGQNTTTNYTYMSNAGFLMPQEKDEFDFGVSTSSAPTRKTFTTYQSFSGAPGHLSSFPCKTVVYDSAGNAASETDLLYDGGTTVCGTSGSATTTGVSGLVSGTHDETTYAPGSTTPRGNVTTQIKWLNGGTSPATTLTYDETGQVLTSVDPCGNTTCSDMSGSSHTTIYSYADAFTILSGGSNVSYPAPNGVTNAYVTQITDPLGHASKFTYDYFNGQLTSAKDPNDVAANRAGTTYVYNDFFARPTQITNPDGGQTTYLYNDSSYNATANTPNVTKTVKINSSVNETTLTATDGMGHVVRTILSSDPEGADTTDTTFDGFGRVFTQSNPHRSGSSPTDGTTTYTYDALGRTTSILKQDNSTAKTSYDQTSTISTGTCTVAYDEAGKIRKSCSDGLGRLVEVDEPGSGANSGTPGMGSITINGQGQSTTYTYTYGCGYQGTGTCTGTATVWNGGNIYVTINGFTASTSYGGTIATSTIATNLAAALNVSGSPVSAVPSGSTISVTAKTAGSFTNYAITTSATWNTQYFSGPAFYASAGPMSGGTDGFGSNPLLTQYSYDILGNLTCAVQKGADTTTFSTCAAAPAAWRPRSFVYDSLSRLTSATNPESGTISYTYDANSNVQNKTAPAPNQTGSATVTTSYTYDALNRVTRRSYNDGTTPSVYLYYDLVNPWGTSYPYDYIGRLNQTAVYDSANNLVASSYLHYDPMGRVIMEAQCTPHSCANNAPSPASHTSYTYNLIGNLTSEVTPEFGPTISYAYSAADRVTQVTSTLSDAQHPGTLLTVQSYSAPGAITQMTYGNGQLESHAYNNRLQPTELKSYNSSNFVRYDFIYGYNAGNNNGNLTSWNSTGWDFTFTRSYGYDALNRLATMTDSAANQSCKGMQWSYDAWGNRTSQAVTAGSCRTFSAAATAQNQLVGFQYDAAGNMTYDGGHSYTYDAENRLIKVDGGSTATYVYDANGRRVEKNTGSGWLDYVLSLSGNARAEVNANGWQVGYIYSGGSLIAQYKNSTTYFVQSDHLGSTRLLTGADGSGQQSYDYAPFGELTQGVFTTSHLFTGKERDLESGLDNFGARYLGSNLGRFETADPLPWLSWQRGNSKDRDRFSAFLTNPQNLNLYAYVLNNPLNKTDPTGMYQCDGTPEQCAAVREGLADIRAAAANLKVGTSGRKALDKVLKFYGAENTNNGVNINFNNHDPNALGSTSTAHGVTTISFGANALAPLGPTGKGETVAHEGTHGVDQKTSGKMPQTFWQFYDTEYHAYQAESAVDKGVGSPNETDDHPVWFPGITPQQRTTNITRDAYSNACADVGGC